MFFEIYKGFGFNANPCKILGEQKKIKSQITVWHSYTRFNNLFKEIYLRHCLVKLLVLCRKTNHYKR